MADKLISVDEAAKIMKMNKHTVRKYVRLGVLEGYQYMDRGKIYINYFSIPTNLRNIYERSISKKN